MYQYKEASATELERIWEKDLILNAWSEQWATWRVEYIENNKNGKCKTFVVLYDSEPVGKGTLLFSGDCSAINGRKELADGIKIANVNALHIEKTHRGKGHISKLVHFMEEYARNIGCEKLTIGVAASETWNIAIYLHWGYDKFVMSEIEDDELILYYAKELNFVSE